MNDKKGRITKILLLLTSSTIAYVLKKILVPESNTIKKDEEYIKLLRENNIEHQNKK